MIQNKIEFGDCRETMRRWAERGVKVNTCVTSPPYFGLRDYSHEGQLGLEKKPDAFVSNLVEVFRCVRDVLADDGTLWLNLGDSYGTGTTAARKQGSRGLGEHTQKAQDAVGRCGGMAKQLLGIPWRVAFALQADGWYLRQDIIWHKPNPMPESVTDRCTKAHEYIFLLSKSPKYYYDHEAVKEAAVSAGEDRGGLKVYAQHYRDSGDERFRTKAGLDSWGKCGDTRNKRTVWTVATKPYKGAHFATFPQQLIEPCILAGCPEGGIVLDPFLGSGTTAVVALNNRRNYLGCELNEEYGRLQQERIQQQAAQTTFC